MQAVRNEYEMIHLCTYVIKCNRFQRRHFPMQGCELSERGGSTEQQRLQPVLLLRVQLRHVRQLPQDARGGARRRRAASRSLRDDDDDGDGDGDGQGRRIGFILWWGARGQGEPVHGGQAAAGFVE